LLPPKLVAALPLMPWFQLTGIDRSTPASTWYQVGVKLMPNPQ